MENMENLSTKELIDKFFEENNTDGNMRNRSKLERPELYEYEKKIGKQLVEMNDDELLDMFTIFFTSNGKYKLAQRSYEMITSMYRKFFDWYIDNVKIIKNPFSSQKLRGKSAIDYIRAASKADVFDKNAMENLIERIHESYERLDADYYEMFIRMFYEGFATGSEIASFKEKDFNVRAKAVFIDGKVIHLSDRTVQLLQQFDKLDEVDAHRGVYKLVRWEGSYVKFKTRESKIAEFNNGNLILRSQYIARLLINLGNEFDVNVNYRLLYLRGFYDWMVSQSDKETIDTMINSQRDAESNNKIMDYAAQYGFSEKNVTVVKRVLLPFVAV